MTARRKHRDPHARSVRRWWLILITGSVVAATALGWMTLRIVHLEREQESALQEASLQESLRLALWRMDSWTAPRLARETARPPGDYEAASSETGEPSPLQEYESDIFKLHFQVAPNGRVTSPQVVATSSANEYIDKAALLGRVRDRLIDRNIIQQQLIAGNYRAVDLLNRGAAPDDREGNFQVDAPPTEQLKQQLEWSNTELSRRAAAYNAAQSQQVEEQLNVQQSFDLDIASESLPVEVCLPATDASGEIVIGPLVLVRLSEDSSICELMSIERSDCLVVLMRRIEKPAEELLQGVVVDWANMRNALLDEIDDLLPAARLSFVHSAAAATSTGAHEMATLPIALTVDDSYRAVGAMTASVFTPTMTTLAVAWTALLIAIAAAALTLRSSISFGERRNRFASAVTHELRTPLTTFRLYTDMLANDMVPSPDKRREYVQTMKAEADRIAGIVENVLAYAQLERGSASIRTESISVDDLLQEHLPTLCARAKHCEMELTIEGDEDAISQFVSVDRAVVGQILFNLVDNACKYAANAADKTVTLFVHSEADAVELTVADCGDGVPAEHAGQIFEPFDRGDRHADNAAPGVGLGLALSRGLARRMGGDLRLDERCSNQGAAFTLSLRRAS